MQLAGRVALEGGRPGRRSAIAGDRDRGLQGRQPRAGESMPSTSCERRRAQQVLDVLLHTGRRVECAKDRGETSNGTVSDSSSSAGKSPCPRCTSRRTGRPTSTPRSHVRSSGPGDAACRHRCGVRGADGGLGGASRRRSLELADRESQGRFSRFNLCRAVDLRNGFQIVVSGLARSTFCARRKYEGETPRDNGDERALQHVRKRVHDALDTT